jgi:NADH:ubiquinone oxidoreductase subunit 6 (subunit J)
MLPKLFIILMLAGAVAALASAALAMLRPNGDSHQMARALTWRIALSVTLFVILLGGFASGVLTPRATLTAAPVTQIQ